MVLCGLQLTGVYRRNANVKLGHVFPGATLPFGTSIIDFKVSLNALHADVLDFPV